MDFDADIIFEDFARQRLIGAKDDKDEDEEPVDSPKTRRQIKATRSKMALHVQSPERAPCASCPEDDDQDPHVGEDDERDVHAHKADDDREAHGAVFLSVVTGQTDQRHVVTVAVLDLVGAAEPQ
ncbi:hypothetical protein INR49_004491 [Caranx melampygus]|nr:hypothetical protein INR49_004491 [Caranx melampygus]